MYKGMQHGFIELYQIVFGKILINFCCIVIINNTINPVPNIMIMNNLCNKGRTSFHHLNHIYKISNEWYFQFHFTIIYLNLSLPSVG